jgi:hypothetical protein
MRGQASFKAEFLWQLLKSPENRINTRLFGSPRVDGIF